MSCFFSVSYPRDLCSRGGSVTERPVCAIIRPLEPSHCASLLIEQRVRVAMFSSSCLVRGACALSSPCLCPKSHSLRGTRPRTSAGDSRLPTTIPLTNAHFIIIFKSSQELLLGGTRRRRLKYISYTAQVGRGHFTRLARHQRGACRRRKKCDPAFVCVVVSRARVPGFFQGKVPAGTTDEELWGAKKTVISN